MSAEYTGLAGRRVLVTGASGFLGGHLVPALIGAGAVVHVLSRTASHVAGAVVHVADLLDVAAVRRAMNAAQPEIVFHLAAYGARPGERDRDELLDVNVRGSLHLWQAMPATVTRVVMAGTSREYSPANALVPETYPCGATLIYPATKHAAVTLLTSLAYEDQRQLIVLRPFGPYGPGDVSDRVLPFTIRKLLAGAPVPLSQAQQMYDFAYIDDHIHAWLLASTTPIEALTRVYNIGSGVPVRLRDVLELTASLITPAAVTQLEFGAKRRAPRESEWICGDISAARRELGYAPKVTLEDGLRRTIAWVAAQR